MPTLLRGGPRRLFVYSADRVEPVHAHVEREDNVAKSWLVPLRLERSGGLGGAELRRIQRIIESNRENLVEAWNAYFGN